MMLSLNIENNYDVFVNLISDSEPRDDEIYEYKDYTSATKDPALNNPTLAATTEVMSVIKPPGQPSKKATTEQVHVEDTTENTANNVTKRAELKNETKAIVTEAEFSTTVKQTMVS